MARSRTLPILLTILASLILTTAVSFATPQLITYQGRLTDAVGDPLPDTTLDITFSIYRADGTEVWTSGPQPVQVTNGLFNYTLGSQVELPLTVMSSQFERFLGVKVGDDEEMVPRTELISVPYAFKVGTIDGASGGIINGNITVTDDIYSADHAFEIFYPSAILFESDNEMGSQFMIGNTFDFNSESGVLRLGTAPEGYRFPASDGSADQILSTNGNGYLGWTEMSSDVSNWTVTDSVLYTNDYWGIARGNAGNILYGDSIHTHVNLGVACTTGHSSFDFYYSTVGGGFGNTSGSIYSTVSGGQSNSASSGYSTVAGGADNTAMGYGSSVGGGQFNFARGQYSIIGGGGSDLPADSNMTEGDNSTIGGGLRNVISGDYGTIGGGIGHFVNHLTGTIGGGSYNSTSGQGSTVGGGNSNNAGHNSSTVSGGSNNNANGQYSTVSGGWFNTADSIYSNVCGGANNTAANFCATVLGGSNSSATGYLSLASGFRAKANHRGSVVITANYSGTGSDSTRSGGNEQMVLRADGGLYLTNTAELAPYDNSNILTTRGGAFLSGNGTTWTNSSDRNKKENFKPVDGYKILEQLEQLKITQWNYKSENENVKHIGPVAQDFFALFGVGVDDKSISTIDPSGIALAAIQELGRRTKELEQNATRIKELEDDLDEVKSLLKELIAKGD